MTSLIPVLAGGAAVVVAVVVAAGGTWYWSKGNGLLTSVLIGTRSAWRAVVLLGVGASIAVAIAAVSAWRTAYEPTNPAVAREPGTAIAVNFCSDFAVTVCLTLVATVLGTLIVWVELNFGGGPRPALR